MYKKRKVIIPIFVPHKGCPNDCVFCNQRKITGKTVPAVAEDVDVAVNERMGTVDPSVDDIEIAFFGGSFTMIPVEEQESLLREAQKYVASGLVKDIRISTRPDGIDPSILERLKGFGVTIVELGVQSMSDEVLKRTKRGYERGQVEKAISLLKEKGFSVGVQVMTGLPGASVESDVESAIQLCRMKPDMARIYPTLVIKDTELAEMYEKGSYTAPKLEEAVEAAAKVLRVFRANKVEVIRIGLQPTDHIAEGGDVISGPFHPALGELVESRYFRDVIDEKLEDAFLEIKNKQETVETLVIHCHKSLISKVTGQKRCNIHFFKEKYGAREVRVVGDQEGDRFRVEFWPTIINFEFVVEC